MVKNQVAQRRSMDFVQAGRSYRQEKQMRRWADLRKRQADEKPPTILDLSPDFTAKDIFDVPNLEWLTVRQRTEQRDLFFKQLDKIYEQYGIQYDKELYREAYTYLTSKGIVLTVNTETRMMIAKIDRIIVQISHSGLVKWMERRKAS
jgi:hypothetical protein